MNNSQTLSRADIRKTIRDKRRRLTPAEQKKASESLLKRLCEKPEIVNANNIAIYLANDGELDPLAFIHWCWQQKKNVYLPVIHPFTKGHLLFLKYDQQSEMVHNPYGIAEPKLTMQAVLPFEQLDIILTPLVAFDEHGNRLGMGGGFYDRTLAKWFAEQRKNPNANSKLKPIGIAHDIQKLDAIPYEHWDIPLPEIITPSKSYHF